MRFQNIPDDRTDNEVLAHLFGIYLDKEGDTFPGASYKRAVYFSVDKSGKQYDTQPRDFPLEWPNFTDERQCDFWIRKMEQILARGDLAERYLYNVAFFAHKELEEATSLADFHIGGTPPPSEYRSVLIASLALMLATPRQRIAAAVKTLKDSKRCERVVPEA